MKTWYIITYPYGYFITDDKSEMEEQAERIADYHYDDGNVHLLMVRSEQKPEEFTGKINKKVEFNFKNL